MYTYIFMGETLKQHVANTTVRHEKYFTLLCSHNLVLKLLASYSFKKECSEIML